jgi:pyruvate/2-oxoglutarate dehydrogenase complex dihydrolipoamide acyltransferase (E2) component
MNDDPRLHAVRVELGEQEAPGTLALGVRIGDHVEAGVVLGIVEGNKTTVELVAPVRGRVVSVASDGPVEQGAVAVTIEHDAGSVSRTSDAVRAARSTPTDPGDFPRELLAVSRVSDVACRVALHALDARVKKLEADGIAHAEAIAMSLSVARALAAVPEVGLSAPLHIAYVAVRDGDEERVVLRLSAFDDERTVASVSPPSRVDFVVLRFHDTVESARALVQGARTIVLSAPARRAPANEPGDARVELVLTLPARPGLAQRMLAVLREQLEHA